MVTKSVKKLNQKFTRVVALMLMCASLAACKTSFDGKLNAREDLSLKTKKGIVKVEAGQRDATLHITSKTEATLEVRYEGKNNNVKAQFKIPTKEIPANGEFRLTAATLRQDYDLEGVMQTDVRDSESRYDYESCQYQVYVGQICYLDEKGRQRCHAEYDYVYGYRNVEYFLRTTVRDLSFELIKGSVVAADFEGRNTSSERVYTYVGICR